MLRFSSKTAKKTAPDLAIYQFDALHGFANPESVYFDRALFLKTLSLIKNEAEKPPRPVSLDCSVNAHKWSSVTSVVFYFACLISPNG